MACHIRHGSPGSFKTAAAIWIDVLSWLRQGRVVYTNVRGMLSVPEIEEALKLKEKDYFPPGAELIVVDTDSNEDRLKFAAWFHWLPIGAAIVIDEGQFIYPNRRDFKPESLDYPGGLDAATKDVRPPDIFTAMDKHRHYNWDICVTTPNLKKLPSWLTGVVEAAYHHKNMEHVPIWGKRKARIHKHDPSTSGIIVTKQSQYHFERIPVAVHSLYGSTITGEVTQNVAETNPLKNPRLIGMFAVAAIAAVASITLIASGGEGDEVPPQAGDPVAAGDARVDVPHSDAAELVPVVDAGPTPWSRLSSFLPGFQGLYIAGHMSSADGELYLYRIVGEAGSSVVSGDFLKGAGFAVVAVTPCAHDLSHPGAASTLRVLCEPVRERASEPSERVSAPENDGLPLFNPAMSSINPMGYSTYDNG